MSHYCPRCSELCDCDGLEGLEFPPIEGCQHECEEPDDAD